MSGFFKVPVPKNEPVLSYAPNSKERELLKKALDDARNSELDIPMYIGGEEVRTDRKKRIAPTILASRPTIKMAPLRICFPKRFICPISRLKPIIKSRNSIPIVDNTLKVSSWIVA